MSRLQDDLCHAAEGVSFFTGFNRRLRLSAMLCHAADHIDWLEQLLRAARASRDGWQKKASDNEQAAFNLSLLQSDLGSDPSDSQSISESLDTISKLRDEADEARTFLGGFVHDVRLQCDNYEYMLPWLEFEATETEATSDDKEE